MKRISLYLIVTFYALAGLNHFINPELYLNIMPKWLPGHQMLVMLSGAIEILLSLLFIFPATRRIGAWGTILFLIAVFPANIQMLINFMEENNKYVWVAILRLPLQILLMWWAYSFTKPYKI